MNIYNPRQICFGLAFTTLLLANSASALLSAPTLSGPANGATGISTTPTFSWSSVSGANRYWLMVSTSPSDFPTDPSASSCATCVSVGLSGNTTSTSYTPPTAFPNGGTTRTLNSGTTYYWKVQGWNTSGVQGNYSSVYFFTTASSCSYSISPNSASPGASSGSGSFGMTAGSGCSWSATPNQSWIHTTSSGTGSGTVSYSYDANTSTSSRSGTITAGGQTFTITQAASNPTFQSGNRIKAASGGANVREGDTATVNANSILFLQYEGVHGTIVGVPTVATAGGFSGNWWKINWDSEPPNQNGYQGYSAESVIALAPSAGDVSQPNFSSSYYTTANHFWTQGDAPGTSVPGNLWPAGAYGNCTWYAYGRMLQLGYSSTQLAAIAPPGLGSAYQWGANAIGSTSVSLGVTVNTTPTVGSIAWLDSGSFSSLGHVAVVESVNADGTITVTESSYSTTSTSVWNYLWHHRTVAPTWFTKFIHVSTSPSCSYSISPSSVSPSASSGSGSFSMTAGSGCSWSASTAYSWIHTTSSGSGNGTVSYTYDANANTSSRSGTITAGGQTFTITQAANTGQHLIGVKIGVDPGHGGTDTGAVGPTGLTEKSVNLITALALKKYLEAEGATVVITRTDDSTVSLPSRSALFINNAVNLAISVHHNAGGSLDTTMVFIYCNTSLATRGALASDVVQRLGTSTGIAISTAPASTADTLCSGHTDWQTGLTGVGQANLHMVRETEIGSGIPSILTEVSFITNPTEETKLRSGDYLDNNGWAIYAGVADYYGFTPIPRNGSVDATPPTISVLGVTPSSISLGSSFAINYTVSDAGGSGLSRVELWLATIDGSSTDSSWAKISTTNVSGNGPVSGTLMDTPAIAGTRWYGFHAVDNAGNYKDERQAGVGPIQVTVTTSCSYFFSPSSASPSASSGSGSFSMTAGSGCSWSASTAYSWIHTTSSGSGNGTVSYTYDANASTSSRSGTITAAGQTFTITQAGEPCTYSISPSSASPSASSGSGSFSMTAGSGCSWSASTAYGWIHTSSSGSGSGTVSYTYDANTSTISRSGTITAGGQTFTITQAGAVSTPAITSPSPGSTLSSSSATFQWNSGTSVTEYFFYVGKSLGTNDLYGQSQGLNLSVTVSNLPVNGSTLYVRLWWQIAGLWYTADYTYTAATSCSYSISPSSASPSASSGSGSFSMTAGSGCSWNASTAFSWIHTSSSGSGNGTVSYTYDANTSASSRSGTITAGGQTFTITQLASPPIAPTSSAATSVASSGFTANWSSANGATGYRLDISTSSTFASFISGYQDLDVGNVVNRSVSGLNASTIYYYRVRAYNVGGTSGNSGTITTTTLPNPPSAPTANAATSVTASGFSANWSSASGATGYRLDVSTSSAFSSFVSGYQDLDVGNVVTKAVSGLSAGTTYYYRVRAYNTGGTSGNSGSIAATTVPPTPTANAASGIATNALNANWNAASGATGYRLDVSTNNAFANYVSGYQNLDVGNVLSQNVTGLKAATVHYYRVRAYNGSGTSTSSAIITTATAGPVITFTKRGNNLLLSWPTNDPKFRLFYSTNLSSAWISNTGPRPIVGGQYTITNSMTNKFRFYRLKK